MFTCDEHLAGRSPSQGTELCTVVEQMFSLETMIAVLGDTGLADWLERIAFNALPAPYKPDMKAHQFDTQANQVLCTIAKDRVWCNNGPDAGIFGQEPNFGCCTANQHQGWPKFVSHLWMKSNDGGLVSISLCPCQLTTRIGSAKVRVEVTTDYPFREDVILHVTCDGDLGEWPLYLRIPAWAEGATLQVGDRPSVPLTPGQLHALRRRWSGTTVLRLHLPMSVRTERRHNNAVSILRGPLVYSLAIGERWHWIRGYAPFKEYEVHPTTGWNYALELDERHPDASLEVEHLPMSMCAFSAEGAPIRIHARARRLPDWQLEHNAAAPPPPSPVHSDQPSESVILLPYGAAKLRLTEIPVLDCT